MPSSPSGNGGGGGWLCWRFRSSRRSAQYVVSSPSPVQQSTTTAPTYSWDKRRLETEMIDGKTGDGKKEGEVDETTTVRGVVDGCVVRGSHDENGAPGRGGRVYYVESNKRSVIVLLDWTAGVYIDDCQDCTLVVAVCSGSVFLRNCTGCTLFAVAQQLRIRDVRHLSAGLFVNSAPVIESSTQVHVHPLALSFPAIAARLEAAKVRPFVNLFHGVHDFTPTTTPTAANFTVHQSPISLDTIDERLRAVENVSLDPSRSYFTLLERMEENDDRQEHATIVIWWTGDENETVDSSVLHELRSHGIHTAEVLTVPSGRDSQSVERYLPNAVASRPDDARVIVAHVWGENCRRELGARLATRTAPPQFQVLDDEDEAAQLRTALRTAMRSESN